MVYVSAGHSEPWWFGVAWSGEDLVATALGSTREEALRSANRCVPRGLLTTAVVEPPPYITGVVAMLGELERGNEDHKRFSFSREHLSGAMYRILSAAAAIPIGYVTTYGDIARAAGSEARAVGRAMATNPLYPVVPCHRVVGSDMSLVGYGGKQDAPALAAKLERIAAEARGAETEREVALPEGVLTVYPAERVIQVAREKEKETAEKAAAERMQLRLF